MSIQIRETALTGVLLIEPRFGGVERGLGVLDDQKPRCAEVTTRWQISEPNRTAARDDNRLAFHQRLEPGVVGSPRSGGRITPALR